MYISQRVRFDRSLFVLMVIFFILYFVPTLGYAQDIPTATPSIPTLTGSIININLDNFPQIQADFILQKDGDPLTLLDGYNLQINETQQPLQLSEAQNGSVNTIVLVDSIIGSDVDLLQDTLHNLLGAVYLNEQDHVSVIVGSNPSHLRSD